MPIEVLVLLGLILLNGVFAMSEIALVTARKGRLQALAADGDRGARAALQLNEEPTRFLSTVQVGITSIGVLSGIVGEAAFAEPLMHWLRSVGVEREWASLLSTGLVVVLVTYFSIVFGELVPKRLGQIGATGIARAMALPIRGLALAFNPFVHLLTGSTDLVLRLIGARKDGGQQVTEEEIHALIREGHETGVIDEQERAMVRNVFRLDDRQIATLMTPRTSIVYLDLDEPPEANLRKVLDTEHLRFPVVRGGFAGLVGMLSARQLLKQLAEGRPLDFAEGIEPPVCLPESLNGMELLENFRASAAHLAIVVDEYGDVQGLVTPHDLLEAIAGEFKSSDIDDTWAVQREDGSWLMDGMIPVPEFKDRLALSEVPEEALGRYHTLAGMLILLLARLPHTADVVRWGGWRFEIVDMDGRRIDKVLAQREPELVNLGVVDNLP